MGDIQDESKSDKVPNNWITKLFKGNAENPWSNFIISILLTLVLPLIPLYTEYYYNNSFSERSLTMSLVMMCFTRGATSRVPVIMILFLLIGILFSVGYGNIPKDSYLSFSFNGKVAFFKIFIFSFIFITQIVERYAIHFYYNEKFFNFK